MKFLKLVFYTLIISSLYSCSSHDSEYQGYVEGEFRYLSSPIAGELIDLSVHRGEKVDAQQKLFVLITKPQLDEVNEAKANVLAAKHNLLNLQKGLRPSEIDSLQAQINKAIALLTLSKLTMQRDKILSDKKVLQKQTYDESLAQYKADLEQVEQLKSNLVTARLGARIDEIDSARAKLEAAKAKLAQVEWTLSQKIVYAPTGGRIIDTYYRKGEQIPAFQPVLSFLAPVDKRIIFFIPEAKLSTIKLNQNIQIQCDGCNKLYHAHISYISPQAEYTPPVIYSRESRYKLVFRIKAKLSHDAMAFFHPGQPVQIYFNPVTK